MTAPIDTRRGVIVIGTSDTFETVEAAFDPAAFHVRGYLSPQKNLDSIYPRYAYLGNDSLIESGAHRDDVFVVALYDNARRRDIFARLDRATREIATLVHPSAVVMPSAAIGAGTSIAFFVSVSSMARLGRGVVVRGHAHVAHDASVGDFVFIGPGARVLGRVQVGAGTMIGTGAILFPGVTIGEGCVIGAGAIVAKDVPAGTKLLPSGRERTSP